MIEKNPADVVTAVTRYNYFYEYLARDGGPYFMPGTPLVRGELVMDYAGRGRDKLLSTQKYDPADPDRVEVVVFGYSHDPDEPGWISTADDDSMTSRTETTWVRQGSGADVHWYKSWERTTGYTYFNGQMEEMATLTQDYCPAGDCPSCTPGELTCTADPEFSIRHEFHTFDLFGRRVNRAVCNEWCAVDASCQPAGTCGFEDAFARCKLEHTQYDYDGLSNQVLVERRGPYAQDICELGSPQTPLDDYPILYTDDRFLASYTYGPLGPISRTDEDPDKDPDGPQGNTYQYGDSDPGNNRDYYYLRDAMGGHVGVLFDHDADLQTPGQPAFAVYDSFGNRMDGLPPSQGGTQGGPEGAGSYAWRGGEGSVTDGVADAAPPLIHMQARHYDPTLAARGESP